VDPARTVRDLSRALRAAGDPARAVGARAYLKSDLEFWGVAVPDLRRVSKGWLADRPGLDHHELVDVVRALWKRPVHELRIVGIELLRERVALLGPADVPLVEDLLRRSFSWAYVDALAPKVMGPLFVRHPALGEVLDRWVTDPDFWIRRAALLTLLDPLRRGGGDWERFVAYADRLIEERELFIRKAIGWILREVGKRDPVRVRRFLAARRDRVSALTWREATKYLPAAELASLGERGAGSKRRAPARG
jgi:3-methyladenine DNA glycosylase AlkD